jgi:hypothetical protein
MQYFVAENHLTEIQGDMIAIPIPDGTIDKEGLATHVMDRGSTVTRTDLVATMNIIEEVIVSFSERGYTFNLPLFNTSFSISGPIDGVQGAFDGNNNKLNLNISKGVSLRSVAGKVKLFKTTAPNKNMPEILEVKDAKSGEVNTILTPNRIVELYGNNIKISSDEENANACGLWFVADDGTAVKAETFSDNKASRVVANIPDLKTGSYQVKIVTQYTSGNRLLKAPRTLIYPKKLTVNNG